MGFDRLKRLEQHGLAHPPNMNNSLSNLSDEELKTLAK